MSELTLDQLGSVVDAVRAQLNRQWDEYYAFVHPSLYGMIKRWRNIDRRRDEYIRKRARRAQRGRK